MASNSGGGFSKEQLALAKQLQSGYVTSGTFHSQGQGGSKGSSSPAARMPHATHPVRSQPPQLRSANGLVRPLPGNATRPASLATTGRPAPPVQPSAPTYTTVPPHLRVSLSATKPVTQTVQPAAQSVTQSATQSASTGPAPPVHMPTNNLSYTRPPPMPANLQPAMTPTPMFTTAPETTTVTPAAPATTNFAFNTSSAPRTIQQSPNAQLLETVSVSAFQPQPQPESQTEGRENSTPAFDGLRDDAVAKAIMQGIKINQSGKPIVWNWTSEEPVARELTEVEIEHMKKIERLPPIIYDRPFHENATMKAPGLENKPKTAEAPPRVIGLKGSRHNW